ncbi:MULTISPECIES: two-component system response regulator [unclassified Pedobacter]|uniref:response regulator n=1 Tax=unclassified Pedobacter TaxID=2628915 RepID=UPI001E4CE8E2|nr:MULTISPECIES: response regulator [unclassified Pedobacter]
MIENEILLIDDDEYSLFINKEIISAHTELPIHAFNSGELGLNYLKRIAQDKQVFMFLDLNMPVMNGWAVLENLEQMVLKNAVRVFILTSSVDDLDKAKAKTYSMVKAFFVKPLESEVVEHALQNI